jgi:phosphonate transport system permease protein
VTAATQRPIAPPRVRAILLPVAASVAAFALAGFTADWLGGVLWGLVAGAVLAVSLQFAGIDISRTDQVILVVGAAVTTALTKTVLPELPDTVQPSLVIRFAAAWIPIGLASGAVMLRQGHRPTAALNVAIVWVLAGALAVPGAVTFGALVPIESLAPNQEPSFSAGIFAFFGLVTGLLGISAMTSSMTKLPLLGAIAGVGFFSAFAGAQVGFTIPGLIERFGQLDELADDFWPPKWDWAMGEEAFARWPGIWRFVVAWLVVAAAGYLFVRAREVSKTQRNIITGFLIAVPVIVFVWWLPQWQWGPNTPGSPLLETFRIAIVSATLGCGVALPLAFMASKITAPNTQSYLVAKAFMNFIRTIPDLFWALIFVASVGIGPFAGALALFFFSMAIMAKLQSETIDAVDPGPLEAAHATGSGHFSAVRSSVLPQVLPNYVAYALYIFEINIRASVVIGLAGAGGIGRVIEAQRAFFRFDRVLAVIIVIFVIVLVIEQVSVAMRRRLV